MRYIKYPEGFWIFDIRQLLPIKLWGQKNFVRIQVVVTFFPRRALVSRMVQRPRSRPGCHQTYSFLPPRQTSPVIASIEQRVHNRSPGLPATTAGCLRAPGRFLLDLPQSVLLPVFWYHRCSPYPPAQHLIAHRLAKSGSHRVGHLYAQHYMWLAGVLFRSAP